jgi:hypothetical protein
MDKTWNGKSAGSIYLMKMVTQVIILKC